MGTPFILLLLLVLRLLRWLDMGQRGGRTKVGQYLVQSGRYKLINTFSGGTESYGQRHALQEAPERSF